MTKSRDYMNYCLTLEFVILCKAVAPRAVENLMPPPPAPVVAQPAHSVVAPPGGTVTRQSAMNPQGSIETFPIR